MTVLLDSSVLIALNVGDHTMNEAATKWFEVTDEKFATCAITQGALVRHLVRNQWEAVDAVSLISLISNSPRHEFWPDDVSFAQVSVRGVIGHRQVTDAYLAQLSRHHGGRLATFDKGMVALHKDVVEVVPAR